MHHAAARRFAGFMEFIGTTAATLAVACLLALAAAPAAAASACGGEGQRACCVLERANPTDPACRKGLRESGKCTRNCACGRGPGESIGMCVDSGISACGGEGQRACCVTERVPSCNKGLVERAGCKGDCRCGGPSMGLPSAGTCRKPAADCGGNGEKPCTLDIQIAEGRTSCDKGLLEDFVGNRCVKPDAALAEASCRAVLKTMGAGKLPDPIAPYLGEAKRVATRLKNADARGKAKPYIETYGAIVGELGRIHAELAKQRDLFAPDTLCVPSRLTARLKDLANKLEPAVKAVLPRYSGHFFMAYTLNASAAAGVGVQAGYAVVTDYRGAVGVYVYLGPSIVTNASLADSVGVQFYPAVTLADFDGWGWGFAFSGGPPTQVFSGGVEVAFDVAKPVGIGVSGALGLGALPVDGSVSATHSWKLWSQP